MEGWVAEAFGTGVGGGKWLAGSRQNDLIYT